MKFNVFHYDSLLADLVLTNMTDLEISEKYKSLLPTPEEVAVLRKETKEAMEIDNEE